MSDPQTPDPQPLDLLAAECKTAAADPGPPVRVGGRGLTVADVVRVARARTRVSLTPAARAAVSQSSQALDRLVADGHGVYGLTTGVGGLDGCAVSPAANQAHQRSLLRSHAAGVGLPMLADQVRAMGLARLNALCGGYSGVRLPVVDGLAALLNSGVVPWVPRIGSVGASDLAPLAHFGLVLIGEGQAWFDGALLPGAEALSRASLPPVTLTGRDALALINGLGQTLGLAALALHDVLRLVEAAELAAALTVTALASSDGVADPRVLAAKPHPGSLESARRLAALLQGLPKAPKDDVAAQRSPLSTRTVPHVLGATRDALAHATRIVEVELNAPVDNPIVAPDGWVSSNAPNFEGQHIGQALDLLTNSVTALATQSERRTARLLDPAQSNGLPAFLIHPDAQPGVSSGLMIAQYTAASLVAELRSRSVPTSGQSIPTCANTEDFVSMCALAARRATWVVATAEQLLAIELLVAAQALDLRGGGRPARVGQALRTIRERVPVLVDDRVLSDDLAAMLALLRADALAQPLEDAP